MGLIFENAAVDLLTIISVMIALVYYYLTSTFSFWESKNVPFIKPEILFGNMKDIITFKISQSHRFLEFHHHFKQMGYSYGGIFELRKPVLLICTPDLIKEIMLKCFPSFHDRGLPYDEHFDPLSAHLLFLDGQRWKYIRSKLAPALSTGKLKSMIHYFVEVGESLLKVWDREAESGEPLNVREIMAQYTTDVIGVCAFGLDLNALNGESTFRKMGRKVLEPSRKERILQIVRNVYPWLYKTFKLRQFSEEMTEYFINILRETMEYRRKNNIVKDDFLNYLMKIRDAKCVDLREEDEMKGVANYNLSADEDIIELTEGVVTAQAFFFFLAGFETTASTLSFALHELVLNPDIQEKVREEIHSQQKQHKTIDLEFLNNLVYLEQVLQETLRKYPPAPLLVRQCTKPYKLPNTNTIIEPGTRIFIAPYSMHHDPEYFPDPQKFDPDRFSPENRQKIVPYTYLPFGEGPRICMGKRFSMLEMKTVLTQILSNFSIVRCEKTKPVKLDPKSFLLAPVDGIWLKAIRRKTRDHQD